MSAAKPLQPAYRGDLERAVHLVFYGIGSEPDSQGLAAWQHPLRAVLRLGPDASTADQIPILLASLLAGGRYSAHDLRLAGFAVADIQHARWVNHAGTLAAVEWLAAEGPRAAVRAKTAQLLEDTCDLRASGMGEETLELARLSIALLQRRLQPAECESLIAGEISDHAVYALLASAGVSA